MSWNLSDLKTVKPNGRKVFSCFSCGGGSSMGYKLAGYEVVGFCEIDPKIAAIYKTNLNPRYPFIEGIQSFNKRQSYPDELYNLDILDGSPPCSSFSMAGARERLWGEEKKFREGQAVQVLDDLFFEYIELGRRLQPKVIVAENVKGLIQGNARGYVKLIFNQLDKAGYKTQLFLLNSAVMGVPQARERTFFIASRKDLNLPPITLRFDDKPIASKDAFTGCKTDGKSLSPSLKSDWERLKYGQKKKYFSSAILNPNLPSPTLTSCVTGGGASVMHWDSPRKISPSEAIRLQTFPDDYRFLGEDAGYIIGMSVPPLMISRISTQIDKQWLTP